MHAIHSSMELKIKLGFSFRIHLDATVHVAVFKNITITSGGKMAGMYIAALSKALYN